MMGICAGHGFTPVFFTGDASLRSHRWAGLAAAADGRPDSPAATAGRPPLMVTGTAAPLAIDYVSCPWPGPGEVGGAAVRSRRRAIPRVIEPETDPGSY